MSIREIKLDDLETISILHKKIFDKSYFTVFFEVQDLKNYFQELILLNDYKYVYTTDDKIVGYLIGGKKSQEAVDLFFKKNKIKIFKYMALNPHFILIGFKKLFKKFFTRQKRSKLSTRLFLFGVDPENHQKGIGDLLLKKFESKLTEDCINSYGLYVRTNNFKAIRFYQNRGFIIEFKNFELFALSKQILIQS
jgi:ribosomal protein S18 acetylase RimI-like enzyme